MTIFGIAAQLCNFSTWEYQIWNLLKILHLVVTLLTFSLPAFCNHFGYCFLIRQFLHLGIPNLESPQNLASDGAILNLFTTSFLWLIWMLLPD